MAKKIQIDIEVNGKMQKATVSSKKLRQALDEQDAANKRTAKSAGELDRNVKGAANISANATKNFSKMSQGMGGLVQVYATIAAQVFAITAAFQVFKAATDFRNLIAGQEALGAASGIAYKTITQGIQNATDAQLGYAEAARAAAIGTSAGLTPDQLERLGKAAKNASIALGRDLADSFDRLIRGVVKAEPEVLDELGIILRLQTATEKYAQSIGKPVTALTAFERSQAVANEVLGQAEEKFGLIEAQLDPTTAALNQFLKSFDDIKKSIYEFISGPIAGFAKFLSENMAALVGVVGLFAISIVRSILPNLHQWRMNSNEVIEMNKKKLAELRAELELTKQKYVEVRAAQGATAPTGILAGAPQTGATGFLAGTKTDSKSQGAALRALNHYHKQTRLLEEGSIQKRTGVLKKFTQDQIVMLDKVYQHRVKTNKMSEADFARSVDKMKLKQRELELQMATTGAVGETMFARLGAGAAKFLSALGWISLLFSLGALLYGAVMKGVESLKKVDKQQERVNKQVEQGIEKYKTLNEELQRTNDFLSQNQVSAQTAIVARAGQIQSLDVEKLIQDFNRLDNKRVKNAKGFNELKEKLKETASITRVLGVEFHALGDALENNRDLNEQEIEALKAVAREAGNVKYAFEQAANIMAETDKALDKLIETGSKPFGADLLSQIEEDLLQAGTRVNSLMETASAGPKIPELESRTMRNPNRTGGQMSRNKPKTITVEGFMDGEEFTPLEGNQERFNELKEDQIRIHKETLEQIDEEAERGRFLRKIYDAIGAAVEKNVAAAKTRNSELKRAAEMETKGISLQEKLTNLDAQKIKRSQSLVDLESKKRVQQSIVTALEEEQKNNAATFTSEKRAQLEQARLAVENTSRDITLQTERNRIAEEMDPILRKRLGLQDALQKAQLDSQEVQFRQKINAALNREANIRQKIFDIRQKMAKEAIQMEASEQSARNPFFDEQRFIAEKTAQLERDTLVERQKQINEEYNRKVAAIELEYELLDAQKLAEAAKLKALALEADLKKRYDLKESFEEAAAIFEGLDYSGAKAAALELALATRDANQQGLTKVVEDAERAVEALRPINQLLDSAAKSFDSSLNDAFNAMFASLSDKTMDLGEKLKEIGRGFLEELQKSLTQQFLVRPITDFVGDAVGDFKDKFITKQKETPVAPSVTTPVATPPVTGGGFMSPTGGGGALAQGANAGKLGTGIAGAVAGGGGLDGMGLGASAAMPVYVTMVQDPMGGIGGGEGAAAGSMSGILGGGEGGGEGGDGDEQTKATKKLTSATMDSALETGRNVAALGSAVFALTGNEEAAKKLAAVTAALQLIMLVKDAWDKFMQPVDQANTTANTGALGALTAAVTTAAATGGVTGRYGGVFSNGSKMPGYSAGGIASGPQGGYPATLHGTEAVVPLPNGNEIPVEISGGGNSQQNNSVVVNVDASGGTQTQNREGDGENLGRAISTAVQQELQRQKRPGGILSNLGAA